MAKIYKSTSSTPGRIPTELTLYDFFFDYWPPCRPDVRNSNIPLLIDDDTGIQRTYRDIRSRTDALSLGLSQLAGVSSKSTVAIISHNTLDYLPAVLAVHRIGGTVTPVNPNLSAGEMLHQLSMCSSDAVLVSEAEPAKSAGIEAAQRVGIARERIVLVCHPTAESENVRSEDKHDGHWTIDGLIHFGSNVLEVEGDSVLEQTRFRLSEDNPERLAFLSFSSGTSGLPKGVCILHRSPIANILQHVAHMRLPATLHAGSGHLFTPGQDRALGMLPFFHIYGLVVVLATSVWAGIGVVCLPRFRGTEALVRTTVRHRVSHWYLVPPVIVKLVKETDVTERYMDQLGHVKYALSGAAPLRDDLAKAFVRRYKGVRLGQGYGMTETCASVLMSPSEGDYVPGSAGVLLPATEMRIVAKDGQDAQLGDSGELWVRGPQVSQGYLKNEKETRESYLPDGWFRTGDEVVVNPDGLVFIVDRLKEIIKTQGYQVAPAELEGLLLDSSDVRDAGVVGRPDESKGEVPVAFVSLSDAAQERVRRLDNETGRTGRGLEEVKQGLKSLVQQNKVRYKHLADVFIVGEIPRNPSGKILRKELRRMLAPDTSARGASTSSGSTPSRPVASSRL